MTRWPLDAAPDGALLGVSGEHAACAGITLEAVATALGITLRLRFSVDSDASWEQLAPLLELTERHCAAYQSLRAPPKVEVAFDARR